MRRPAWGCISVCSCVVIVFVIVTAVVIVSSIVLVVAISSALGGKRRLLLIRPLRRCSVSVRGRWTRWRRHCSAIRCGICSLRRICHLRWSRHLRGHGHGPGWGPKSWLCVVAISSLVWRRASTLFWETLGRVIPRRTWRASLRIHGGSWSVVVHRGSSGWGSAFWFSCINIQAAHPHKDVVLLIEICLPLFAWECREGTITESWLAWRFLRLDEGLSRTVHLTGVRRLCHDLGKGAQNKNRGGDLLEGSE